MIKYALNNDLVEDTYSARFIYSGSNIDNLHSTNIVEISKKENSTLSFVFSSDHEEANHRMTFQKAPDSSFSATSHSKIDRSSRAT